MKRLLTLRILALCVFHLQAAHLHAGDEVRLITIPVRVHLVHSDHEPDLNTTLLEADVQRIFTKVNRIWSQAGIRFSVESVSDTHALEGVPSIEGATDRRVVAAMPKDRLLQHGLGLNVCYVKDIAPNGYWSGGLVVVKDTASLREVPGGIDEPVPRVTSHELGHALGLPHRQDVTNLMASGTTGFTLNEAEIQTARSTALAKFDKTGSAEAVGK